MHDDNTLIIIGRNIAGWRKKQGMTQEDLAGAAEIDRSYLSEIENGRKNATILTLLKLARNLDCAVDDFLESL